MNPTMLPTLAVGRISIDPTSSPCLTRGGIPGGHSMSEALLRDIAEYCRSAGIAESTFGRLAVNDGKLVGRLRLGGRVTTDTVERVRAFIAREPPPTINGTPTAALSLLSPPTLPPAPNFRFYDNRQKYLLFVTTCSEKQV